MKRRQAFLLTTFLAVFVVIGVAFWFAITSNALYTIAELGLLYAVVLVAIAVIAPKTSKWAKAGR